jgi:excisionase family DNA binding protein
MRPIFLPAAGLYVPPDVAAVLGPLLARELRAARRRGEMVHPEVEEAVERLDMIGRAWENSGRSVAHVVLDVANVDTRRCDDFRSITVERAAVLLRVTRSAVTACLRRGSLHGQKDGRAWRVCAQDVSARQRGQRCTH